MKNRIFFLATIIGFAIMNCAIAQESNYEITGRIEGAEGITFTLQKVLAGKTIYLDTAKVVDGIFIMTGKSAEYPEMVMLVSPDRKRILPFFLENTKIYITGRLDSLINAKISGSKSNDEYVEFQTLLKPFTEKMTKLTREYRSANESIMKEMKETQKDFIKNNPGSYVTPYLLSTVVKDMKPEEIESIINSMDPKVVSTPVMTEIKSGVAAKISVGIGKKAPDFTLNDINGGCDSIIKDRHETSSD